MINKGYDIMTLKKVFNYTRMTLYLIFISSIIRIIIASNVELNSAEVYYWAYSLKLQWNYFDHPPMVAWLIRLTTANQFFHSELFIRLGAIIASAICTWLIFKIGTAVKNQQAGWYAALLYTSSVYSSFIAGTFILPDSPQMVFWLYSLLVLIKISHANVYNHKSDLLWCFFGILSGLCIMSKVHGIFLWLGVVLYAIFINRNWLQYRGVYVAAIITSIIVSPIIIWNIQHDFISYKFHSSRVSLVAAGMHGSFFIKQLFGVIFLTTNPVNFFLICSSILWAFKEKHPVHKKDIQIILFCGLPLIGVLLIISLFRETLAHWSGPAYSCLLILPAIKLASGVKIKRRVIPNGIKAALAYMIILAFSEVMIVNYYPGTTSGQKEGLTIGTDDLSLDMYGWQEAGKKFDSLYKSDAAKKIMPYGAPIIVTNWFPAAHIDFYIAAKTKQQTVGIGNITNLHQYYWMNQYKKPLHTGDSAYYIVPSNLFNYKTFEEVTNSFLHYDTPFVISQYRNGFICKQLYIFRLRGYTKAVSYQPSAVRKKASLSDTFLPDR